MVELMGALLISTGLLFVILIVLVIVWAFQPSNAQEKREVRGTVKKDLKKIKDQINGEHD